MFLEIEIIKNEKKELEFLIKGERHTFPNFLREELIKLPYVDFAAYRLHHPTDKEARMIIRVSSKSPKTALSEALKNMRKTLNETKKEFKKALSD